MMTIILALLGLLNIAQSSHVMNGWLVDNYCWHQNGMAAADTGVDLQIFPNEHTVFCLYEVAFCVASGYSLLNDDDADGSYEISYALDDAGNAMAKEWMQAYLDDGGNSTAQIGFWFEIEGHDDGSDILRTVTEYSGYLVDLYCWDDNNKTSLDTDIALDWYPDMHTIHCLYEVEICRDSGFAMLVQQDDDSYDILAILDDEGKDAAELEIQAWLDDGNDADAETGFMFTWTGYIDGEGTLVTYEAIDSTMTPGTTDMANKYQMTFACIVAFFYVLF